MLVNTQEVTLGKTQLKESISQFSQEYLERTAETALYFGNIQNTDENIGVVIHYILKAEHLYKPEIGTLDGFVKMYIQFALKTIRRDRNKKKKEIPISVLEANGNKKFDTKDPKPSKESELFSHISFGNRLTEKQNEVIYRLFHQKESINQIAKSKGLSRESVNKLKIKALEKLKCLKSELI